MTRLAGVRPAAVHCSPRTIRAPQSGTTLAGSGRSGSRCVRANGRSQGL